MWPAQTLMDTLERVDAFTETCIQKAERQYTETFENEKREPLTVFDSMLLVRVCVNHDSPVRSVAGGVPSHVRVGRRTI